MKAVIDMLKEKLGNLEYYYEKHVVKGGVKKDSVLAKNSIKEQEELKKAIFTLEKKNTMREIREIILHTADHETATAEDVLRWHTVEREWDDIGYHAFGYKNGSIVNGRPIAIQGAHCKEVNKYSIGYCLQGKDKFAFEQLEAFRQYIYGMEVLLGKKLKIKGHYEYNPGKTCPNLKMDIVREFVREEKYLTRVELFKKMGVLDG